MTTPLTAPLHPRTASGAVPTVVAAGLTKTYPNGVAAVREVNFEVAEGEIFGLLGPNGAGKTTTLAMLTTTALPTAGSAVVAGRDVGSMPLDVRGMIGVAFQDSVLDNEFSGRENLRLHARLWRVPPREADRRANDLLELMGLAQRADDNVRTYSGGMRRRLEIARALLAKPRVVFLDEPTVGLDPTVRDEIWTLIRRLRREEGVTVVLSTHYLEEAEDVCDRVAIMHLGEIVAIGRPADLVHDVGGDLIEVHVEGDPTDVVRDLTRLFPHARPPLLRRGAISLPVSGGDPGLADRVAALHADRPHIVGSTLRRTTLADVFAHLTGQDTIVDERTA